MSSSNGTNSNSTTDSSCAAVRMVIQRYRCAKLLIAEQEMVTVGTPSNNNNNGDSNITDTKTTAGVLAYISFAKTATRAKAEQAARTLLNLPVLTLGAWGDGSSTQSILQLSADEYHKKNAAMTLTTPKKEDLDTSTRPPTATATATATPISPLSLVLVPQANVTAKVKKLGKSIQYRDQIAKAEGQALYEYFVDTVEALLVEHYELVRQGEGGGLHKTTTTTATTNAGSSSKNKHKNSNNTPSNNNSTPDPSIPPSRLFHQDNTLYGSFENDKNDNTFPLTYANGEPLTKSARKKLQKIYNAHVTRHAKYLASLSTSTSTTSPTKNTAADTTNLVQDTKEKTNDAAATVAIGIAGQETAPPTSPPAESTIPSPPPSSTTTTTTAPPIIRPQQQQQQQQQQQSLSLDPSFVQLVAGTFGKRQGLELQSDMGPFCHVVEIDL
jgi:hypothetical protein